VTAVNYLEGVSNITLSKSSDKKKVNDGITKLMPIDEVRSKELETTED